MSTLESYMPMGKLNLIYGYYFTAPAFNNVFIDLSLKIIK